MSNAVTSAGNSRPGVTDFVHIGLENVTVEVVMARAPDGSDVFEVVRFQSPTAEAQEPAPAANRPGLRHVAFKVDDIRAVVDRVRQAGWETVGEIVGAARKASRSSTRPSCGPLLDKPVEFALPTHGEPTDRAALERALA